MNELLLRALRCEQVPRPPVWLMRQAGRYMPQYRALRQKHSLWEMFHQPELAAQVTQLPIDLLGVDAAILFSDILVIAEALGLTVHFPDSGGPRVEPAIHTPAQVATLPYIPVEESLTYVFQTIELLKPRLNVPLIGFCGGPFTVASYFIDSTSKQAFERTKCWLKEDPRTFHQLLDKITAATIAYLKGQVRAGADVLQVFDSWANILDDAQFAEFCLPYLGQIVNAFRGSVPVILFCRSSSLRVEGLAALQPTAISYDWHVPMLELRKKTPEAIAVQGNVNPELLKFSSDKIAAHTAELLNSMKHERGWIVNLGHGVTPDIPIDNVRSFVDNVIQYS